MRRLVFAACLLGMLGVVGSSPMTGTAPARHELPGQPDTRVVSWLYAGGFATGGMLALRAPALVVYADGRAIIDATTMLQLPPAEVVLLVETLRRELGPLAPTYRPGRNSPQTVDAPSAVLEVRAPDGQLRSVHVDDFFFPDWDPPRYPVALSHSAAALADARARVLRLGHPYTGERVRLVVQRDAVADPATAPWPADLPVPRFGDQQQAQTLDLAGPAAQSALHLSATDRSWRTLRLPDGQVLSIAVRHLLPDE